MGPDVVSATVSAALLTADAFVSHLSGVKGRNARHQLVSYDFEALAADIAAAEIGAI